MKKLVRGSMLLALSAVVSMSFASGLKTQQGKVSYAIGFQTGKALTQHSINVSSREFIKGFKDAMAKKKPQLS